MPKHHKNNPEGRCALCGNVHRGKIYTKEEAANARLNL